LQVLGRETEEQADPPSGGILQIKPASEPPAAPADIDGGAGENRARVVDVGWRRGRIARRLYLQDAAGRRISLLLGFTPEDLEDYAAAWLAFPPDLPALVAGDGGTSAAGG
ncbi:MAG: hypothetical protein AAFT19_08790, partial [Pseudomonadota bacterium]